MLVVELPNRLAECFAHEIVCGTVLRCTTTPTVRKKAAGRTGKRIEEARAMFGTADPNTPELMGASNTPWIQPRLQQSGGSVGPSIDTLATGVRAPKLSEEDANAQLAFDALNGALVAHLLERECYSLNLVRVHITHLTRSILSVPSTSAEASRPFDNPESSGHTDPAAWTFTAGSRLAFAAKCRCYSSLLVVVWKLSLPKPRYVLSAQAGRRTSGSMFASFVLSRSSHTR